MISLKKLKELVEAPTHTKRVPSPKSLLEKGVIFLCHEFEQDSHLTVYENGYVLFRAGKRNTVFHIHDCGGDYTYGAAMGKGEMIEEEIFENCAWHIGALFEGERKMEESQERCESAGMGNVQVSYHAISEEWKELADNTVNALERMIEIETVHGMLALLTEKQRYLVHQHLIMGRSQQELSEELGVSSGTVNRVFAQAMKKIRSNFNFELHYGKLKGVTA